MTSSRKGRLDASKVREIRRLFSLGEKAPALAQRFNVSRTTISQVVRRITWASVKDLVSLTRHCPHCSHNLDDAIKLLGAQAYDDHVRGCIDKEAGS